MLDALVDVEGRHRLGKVLIEAELLDLWLPQVASDLVLLVLQLRLCLRFLE